MKLLHELIHPGLTTREGRILRRHAARGIVLREEKILLLFTERYNDFSLPGGGIDEGEEITGALKRELEEETGARDVQVKEHYGFIEEETIASRLTDAGHAFRCVTSVLKGSSCSSGRSIAHNQCSKGW